MLFAFAIICFIGCKKNEATLADKTSNTEAQVVLSEKQIDREAEREAKKYPRKAEIAIAQLQRGYDFAKENGVEKLIEVLQNHNDPRRKQFVSGDYYIWIIKTDFKESAVIVAHPINKAIETRDFYTIKDADGKEFIKDIVRIATFKGEGWVSYKWAHPIKKKAMDKLTYLRRIGDYILNDGFYLKD